MLQSNSLCPCYFAQNSIQFRQTSASDHIYFLNYFGTKSEMDDQNNHPPVIKQEEDQNSSCWQKVWIFVNKHISINWSCDICRIFKRLSLMTMPLMYLRLRIWNVLIRQRFKKSNRLSYSSKLYSPCIKLYIRFCRNAHRSRINLFSSKLF